MLGVLFLCAVAEDIFTAARAAGTVCTDGSRRTPRRCKDRCAECLRLFRNRNGSAPLAAVVIDKDTQDAHAKLALAVTEGALHLRVGQIVSCPFGVVDTAEALDGLERGFGVDDTVGSGCRQHRHGTQQQCRAEQCGQALHFRFFHNYSPFSSLYV